MKNLGFAGVLGWVAAVSLGCRIDAIEHLEVADPPVEIKSPPIEVIPDGLVYTPEVVKLEAELRQHLGLLAGSHLEGRRPGSEGALQTTNYLISTLREAGVRPAAPDGGWFQVVPLAVSSSRSTAHVVSAPPVKFEEGIVLSHGTAAGQFETTAVLVDGGYGITAEDWDRDDYEGIDAKNAVVLVREGVPVGRPAGTIYGTRAHKLERARRAGAGAVLIAPGVATTDETWEGLESELRRPRTRLRGGAVASATGTYGLISSEVETQLRDAMARAETQIHLELETTVTELDDPTVIGRIVGDEHPEEKIVIVAHWDAGGHGAPVAAGGGAEDNAAGVAIALALADRLAEWIAAGTRPVRSIVFVFTASDSLGAFGTQRYAKQGISSPDKVAAAIVLNGFELDDRTARLVAYGGQGGPLDAVVDEVFGERVQREPGGAQHDSPQRALLEDVGIPSLSFSRRGGNVELDDAPFDPTTDLHDLALETDALFDLVWKIATDPEMPRQPRAKKPLAEKNPEDAPGQ